MLLFSLIEAATGSSDSTLTVQLSSCFLPQLAPPK